MIARLEILHCICMQMGMTAGLRPEEVAAACSVGVMLNTQSRAGIICNHIPRRGACGDEHYM